MNKLLYILLLTSFNLLAQKQVAFTFDDIPNARLGESVLLHKIDSLQLPSAIFINEQKLKSGEGYIFNKQVLGSWIENQYITPGNHTYSHARASTSNYFDYKEEINRGETLTRQFCEKNNKELKHFRFPYNDLGRDSLQQDSLKQFLNSKGYKISPFTIESSDWMFNAVYKNYIKQNNSVKAKEIGNLYVSYTLELFDFYDSIAYAYHKRDVKQIYLCHDNLINRDYITILYQKLKEKNYSFVSFDQALEDPIYNQPTYFNKKYGVSWFYRWVKDVNERNSIGRSEPTCSKLEGEYEAIK